VRTMITMEELLRTMVERGGSDLHISAGSAPRYRIDGELVEIPQTEVMGPEQTKKLVYSVLDNDQIARFEQELELDMSFGLQGVGRFRVNVFMQRGAVGSVLRTIPYEIFTFEQLGVPVQVCKHLCSLAKGLVLVTGATGSGKSTTLASMIDHINQVRKEHIVTIEDPIEFVHRNKSCLVNQREVGSDTLGFNHALRRVLRQDPDVVLIGEMRDKETIEAGLTLAETGHLTFATLHTSDCVQTINRVVDVFPAHQQNQIRTQLSFVLEGVFCQQLLSRSAGRGRVLCAEIMLPNSAIRSLIREDKCHQILSHIQTGGKIGMRTMNQSLYELYKHGAVTWDEALSRSGDVEDMKRMARQDGQNVV
jgi:twitching motility protein PilT